jgi:hypothetical protein
MMPNIMRGNPTVIHHVGMGEAGEGVRAVPEGKHRWRRHEAKRRKGQDQNCKPETQAGRERDQHDLVIIFACPQARA